MDSSDAPRAVLVECKRCGRRFEGPDLIGVRCPQCGGELIPIAEARLEPILDEPIVEVYRAPDWLQAEMIREHLEAQGILIAFRTMTTWTIYSFTVDGLGEVGILALQSRADEVRKLIGEYLEQLQSAPEAEGEEQETES